MSPDPLRRAAYRSNVAGPSVRADPTVPIEHTVGALAELVK